MKAAVLILILLLLLPTLVYGQAADGPYEVPSKYISLLLVNDAECPVRLSEPTRVLAWSYGGIRLGYTLQNVSTSDVKSIYFKETDWFGSSGYSGGGLIHKQMRFTPWMTYSTFNDPYESAIPFDDLLTKKVSFAHRGNKVWIAMIVKVTLSDGRAYDATKKFDELETFLRSKEFENYSENEMTGWEEKVRNYVATMMKAQPKP